MCGFAGFLGSPERSREQLARDVMMMADTLAHRGPSDRGVWTDEAAGVALGFRRLSIVDLSDHGHQPMASASGRYVMVFNGEVYNHVEIRRELESLGHRFRGHSDSEVIVAAFEQWGVETAVGRFVGMFAIALWDRSARALHLLRDRLGIKPLYIFWRNGTLLFASELKALMAHPAFERTINPQAVAEYLRFLYVPAPLSIFRHTTKLLPGHILSVTRPEEMPPPSRPYWDLATLAQSAAASRRQWNDHEAVEQAEELITDAVRLRMRADVRVGAFLSGGIDSSVVVALMRTQGQRVRTFTVGFDEREYDEAHHARAIAGLLDTEHTEVRLRGSDALAIVPDLPDLFDEPLADPSQIPTWLISRVAREEVTVALSGDGGDEVFAGYNRYLAGARLLPWLHRIPGPARQLAARGVGAVSASGWDRAYQTFSPVIPRSRRHRLPGEKLGKVGELLASGGIPQMYRSLVSAWQYPAPTLVRGARDELGQIDDILRNERLSLVDRMMLTDQLSYLPDDLLAKVDRASMAVSLEVRVPLLDHRVVEFGWSLPSDLKIREGKGKWLLRQILRRHVPEQVFERPKMGFSVPVAEWLRGPLREWASDLLAPERLLRGGILHPRPIGQAWERLQRGDTRLGLALWSTVVFQAWHERWVEQSFPAPAVPTPGSYPSVDGATCTELRP